MLGTKVDAVVRHLAVLFAVLTLASCAAPSAQRAAETLHEIEVGHGPLALAEGGTPPGLPALTEQSGLEDCLRYAALNNPGLRAAFDRWRGALERVAQVTTLPDPRLTLMGMWMEGRSGLAERRVEVMQEFPWFGKLRLRGEVALAEADAERQRFEAAALDLAFRVKDAFYELYYLARAIAVTTENIDLLKYIEAVARSLYQVGSTQYADVIRSQVELAKLEDDLRTLHEMKAPTAARLNAALNRPSETAVPLPKAIPEETLETDAARLLAQMREANPELKALGADVARQQAAVRLAEKDFYPDFSLGLRLTDTASVGGMDSDSLMPMIGLTLPIWRGKYRAARNEAKAMLSGAQLSLADRANALSAEIEMAWFKFRDATRKIGLYRDTLVPKAQQSLKATETAYKAAKASLADLIDAERVLLAFRLEYERALADRAQRLAELESLIGRPLPRAAAESPGWEKGEQATQPAKPSQK